MAAVSLLGAAPTPERNPASASDLPFTTDGIMASLDQVLDWYRQARIAMRSANGLAGVVFGPADEQTARHLVERGFDTARAQAALIGRPGTGPDRAGATERAGAQREQLEGAIRRGEQELERLQRRMRTAAPAQRRTLEREALARRNQLDLDRVRFDFIARLGAADSSLSARNDDDLAHRIQALHDAVPELASGAAPAATTVTSPDTPVGPGGPIRRLLALQRARRGLDDLAVTTGRLERAVDRDLDTVRNELHPVTGRLRALAGDPTAEGLTLEDSERQFHDLLERAKRLAAIVIPLREQSALAHRFAGDLQGWQRAVDRQSLQLLQTIGLDFAGVLIAVAAILIGALMWRVAVVRYVRDHYRSRLLLMIRNVVVGVAIGLVIIFHFTTELTALVTALGFAAAGIALALQNVILAVAGYFSMVAPNGIRVGDRVGLQGPFGYVHGEVLEIGFVRIRLRELAGEPRKPTGRTVVFSNSVVFTGSFFKEPVPREEPPARAAA